MCDNNMVNFNSRTAAKVLSHGQSTLTVENVILVEKFYKLVGRNFNMGSLLIAGLSSEMTEKATGQFSSLFCSNRCF